MHSDFLQRPGHRLSSALKADPDLAAVPDCLLRSKIQRRCQVAVPVRPLYVDWWICRTLLVAVRPAVADCRSVCDSARFRGPLTGLLLLL